MNELLYEYGMESNKMLVIALTGGIGCGKSAAAAIFSSLGVQVIDVDLIARELTASNQPLIQRLAAEFGNEFITKEGALDREKMRKLVFHDVSSRLKLEAILHPAIYASALQILEANCAVKSEAPYQILAIPLLTKNSLYQHLIKRVLVIDCNESEQIKRTMQRSGLTEQEVRSIISAQISRKARLELANDVIENNGSLNELQQSVLKVHKKYINTCLVNK